MTTPRRHYSTSQAAQHTAPTAEMRAVLRGELIYRGGRHVAALRGDGLFRTFDGGRELLRGALLFHLDVLRLAASSGAQVIVATERGSGQRYRITLADFARLCWAYSHPTFGDQRGLDLARWERMPNEGEAVQLGLFGEVNR